MLKRLYTSSFHSSHFPIPTAERETLIRELTSSGYMPRDTVHDYFSQVAEVVQWRLETITIDLWVSPDSAAAWIKKMPTILRRLDTLRRMFQFQKPIRFVCVPINRPRLFPVSPSVCLGKSEVNGGYTYLNGNTVYLFRKEEMPKVLLHEYLHQIQGPKDLEWTPATLNRLHRVLRVEKNIDLRPNESVIEFWAWYYHQQFLSIETGISSELLWEAEKRFVFHQAQKIWTHQLHCSPTWSEGTPVLSYYLLKTLYSTMLPKPPMASPSSLFSASLPWRLDYSPEELVAWIETHWPAFSISLSAPGPGPAPAAPGFPKDTARMTLLGDI
jgi:hypothetical protein